MNYYKQLIERILLLGHMQIIRVIFAVQTLNSRSFHSNEYSLCVRVISSWHPIMESPRMHS